MHASYEGGGGGTAIKSTRDGPGPPLAAGCGAGGDTAGALGESPGAASARARRSCSSWLSKLSCPAARRSAAEANWIDSAVSGQSLKDFDYTDA